MDMINMCYIDDDIDLFASKYLHDYKNEKAEIIYYQITFTSEDTYKSLLEKNEVKEADILVIDSMLFKNSKMRNNKLSGEEFAVIVRKVYPYKEVMVITQNDIDGDYGIFKKYDSSSGMDSSLFFEKEWEDVLNKAVIGILSNRKLLKRIGEKKYVETYFWEQMQSSLKGNAEYEELTVKDIDKLVEAFEKVKGKYEYK